MKHKHFHIAHSTTFDSVWLQSETYRAPSRSEVKRSISIHQHQLISIELTIRTSKAPCNVNFRMPYVTKELSKTQGQLHFLALSPSLVLGHINQ